MTFNFSMIGVHALLSYRADPQAGLTIYDLSAVARL